MAQPFDASAVTTTGAAVPLAENVRVVNVVAGDFSVSRTGVLTYVRAFVSKGDLEWFDRRGQRVGTAATDVLQGTGRLAPDERRAALLNADPSGRTGLLIRTLD